jgi:hypothetical protein
MLGTVGSGSSVIVARPAAAVRVKTSSCLLADERVKGWGFAVAA